MGKFNSNYGGILKPLPLKNLVRRGEGDDFILSMAANRNRSYGTLAIKTNSEDYSAAVEDLNDQLDDVMIVGVEDTEAGSPYIFVRKVEHEGKVYMFPAIFNAMLCDPNENGDYSGLCVKSFHLRIGEDVDPERLCTLRINYAPGKKIEWSEDEVNRVFACLEMK